MRLVHPAGRGPQLFPLRQPGAQPAARRHLWQPTGVSGKAGPGERSERGLSGGEAAAAPSAPPAELISAQLRGPVPAAMPGPREQRAGRSAGAARLVAAAAPLVRQPAACPGRCRESVKSSCLCVPGTAPSGRVRGTLGIVATEQLELISSDPRVMSGQAVLTGTRIPVSVILYCLAAGMSPEQIVQEYPSASEAGIRAAAAYGALLARDEIVPLPTGP